ncbi:MAG: DUF6179 domain-containing protein [Clostridium sp.]|uniref:DUF6179 domain-containing protein n=1 Tax=Clostridium sp. TaxID=1506 RepID=UPI003D6D61B7
MMNSIEKQNLIKKEKLNQECYLQSILQEAYSLKLLTDSELENIQMQCIKLLAKQTERYTSGDSSSVKAETAESILQSIFYSIGIYLKSFQDTDRSLEVLKQEPLIEFFQHGKRLIEASLSSTKEMLYEIQNNIIITDNIAYNDTIKKGIEIFFSTYDVEFAAQDTPASIDYPLSNDKMELVGIEYMNSYLEKLSFENEFCKNFTDHDIHCLLLGYDEHYKDLLINIFGLVLTNLAGSLLADKNTLKLNIEPSDRVYLQQKLANVSKENLDTMLQSLSIQLCKEFNISERILQKYVADTLMDLSERLKNALENNQLEKIFISLKGNYTQPSLQFEDGVKMNDELFRSIASEIRVCRFVRDKITIIKREVHSIIDLIDILEGDCIFDDELYGVFQSFGDMELALLLKDVLSYMIGSNYLFVEDEKEWHKKFNCFLKEIDLTRSENIRELSENINLNLN